MPDLRSVLIRVAAPILKFRYLPRRYTIADWLARKLTPPDGIVQGRIGPYRAQFDFRVGIHREMAFGLYDRRLWDVALAPHIQTGDVVYDVGANIGYFTLLTADRVGDGGQVHAFEPVPANHMLLRQTCRANGISHVRISSLAVSDQDGVIVLHVPRDSRQSTGEASIVQRPGHTAELEARTIRLDDYVFHESNPMPRLVKIDAEGAEPRILAGMTRMMSADNAPIIVCEVNSSMLAAQRLTPAAITRPLLDAGYRLWRVTWDGLRETDGLDLSGFVDLVARK